MPNKIYSKAHKYGDENESTWPPVNGTKEKGLFYWDTESQTYKRGSPPPRVVKFGEAPYFISDTIKPYYHPSALKWVDSRSQLKAIDESHGTITTDKYQDPDSYNQRVAKKEREDDIKAATRKAVNALDYGMAPISEETREMCKQTNEQVSKALNFDAFNVAGRKNDARGKKYRRK